MRPLMRRVSAQRWVPGEEVFDAFERLYQDVADVRQILLDSDRTSARLVVNPARVVVEETRRSFAYLSLYGVATDAILVNRLLPRDAVAGYFARWAERERTELAEIERSFPVPLLRVPLQPREPIGREALLALADALYGKRDPAELFTRTRPIRLSKHAGRTVLEVALPGVCSDQVDVMSAGGELLVKVHGAQRIIALPDSVAGRRVESTALVDGTLEVVFAP